MFCYIFMGWAVIFFVKYAIVDAVPCGILAAAFGRACVYHRRDSLWHRFQAALFSRNVPWFVLAGSVLQFLSIFLYVL